MHTEDLFNFSERSPWGWKKKNLTKSLTRQKKKQERRRTRTSTAIISRISANNILAWSKKGREPLFLRTRWSSSDSPLRRSSDPGWERGPWIIEKNSTSPRRWRTELPSMYAPWCLEIWVSTRRPGLLLHGTRAQERTSFTASIS